MCSESAVNFDFTEFLLHHFSLQQIWDTSKVCKSFTIVLKHEIDVKFPSNEVIILAIDSLKRVQVSVFLCALLVVGITIWPTYIWMPFLLWVQ